jgi:outer membrane protein, heavy metal efflux system
MKLVPMLALALASLSLLAPAAQADAPLSLSRVIELASAQAPDVRLAESRVAEGEARLAKANVVTLDNPKLDLAAGPRSGAESGADVEAGIEIPVELGARRSKRVAVAQAGARRERQNAGEARRQSVASAVGAYYRLLHAGETVRFVQERKGLAEQLLLIARERHSAGDVARFEVNLARTELARIESDLDAAQVGVAQARTALAKALGLPSAKGIEVSGELKERGYFDAVRAAAPPAARSDIEAALADVEASRAAVDLANAERLPDLSLRLSYRREGRDNIALAGMTVTLPVMNPRRGELQEARVQHERAVTTAALRRTALGVEVEGAQSAYDAAVQAARRLEEGGLALVQENDALAAESYRAGKINLSTLLQLRREALETRRAYLERLLQAADAGIELALAQGSWSGTR